MQCPPIKREKWPQKQTIRSLQLYAESAKYAATLIEIAKIKMQNAHGVEGTTMPQVTAGLKKI